METREEYERRRYERITARLQEEARSCTCHPDERPEPCQRKYAFGDCVASFIEKFGTGRTTLPEEE